MQLVYSSRNGTGDVYLSKPFYIDEIHLWCTLSCAFFQPQDIFARKITLSGVEYNTSSIACVLLDHTQFLDYRTVTNSSKELATGIQNRLPSITNSYMFVTDNLDLRLLYIPDILAQNYNYSSVFSPELTRYSGFRNESMKRGVDELIKQGENDYLNYTLNVVSDPTTPTLVTAHQVHVRSKQFVYRKTPESMYTLKYLFYFSEQHLKAGKTLIQVNINAAQYQINYLALIIIIIICAIVMCISFK